MPQPVTSSARNDHLRHAAAPSGTLRDERGMTLLMVLLAVVVIGLSAGIAGSTWKDIMARVREKELLFRGDQYQRAIASYYNVKHGGAKNTFPSRLEELLKDSRFPGSVRHLRRLWPDPVTGEAWVPIKDPTQGGRIVGVKSGSTETPFKQDGFEKKYEDFKGKQSYQEWEFVYKPPKTKGTGRQQGQPAKPGQPAAGGQPGQPATGSQPGQPAAGGQTGQPNQP